MTSNAARRLAPVTGAAKVVSPYCRVSALMGRDDEDLLSVDLQLAACRREIRAAQSAGVNIVEGPALIPDVDETGTDFNRKGIQQALEWKRAGKIDGIVVLDVSRVGRTAAETLAVIEELRADDGVFLSSRERFDATPTGDYLLTNFVGLAQMQSENIAAGWRAVIEHRARQGHQNGFAPTGYIRERYRLEGDEKDRTRIVIDPVTGPSIAEAFRRYDAQESATSIERDLGRRGVLSLKSVGTLKPILENPFYIGQVRLFTYTGKARKRRRTGAPPVVLQGNHAALLIGPDGQPDVALFTRVGKRLDRERRTAPRHITPTHALAGIAYCPGKLPDGSPCNRAMVSQRQGKGKGKYLRCGQGRNFGCDAGGTPLVADVEEAVREAVRGHLAAFEIGDGEIAASTARRAGTAADRARLAAIIARLDDAKSDVDADFYSEIIDRHRHRAAVAKLDERAAKVRAQLDALGDPESGPTVEEFVVAARRVDEVWDVSTPAERNALLRAAGVVRVTVSAPTRWREPVADRVVITFSL